MLFEKPPALQQHTRPRHQQLRARHAMLKQEGVEGRGGRVGGSRLHADGEMERGMDARVMGSRGAMGFRLHADGRLGWQHLARDAIRPGMRSARAQSLPLLHPPTSTSTLDVAQRERVVGREGSVKGWLRQPKMLVQGIKKLGIKKLGIKKLGSDENSLKPHMSSLSAESATQIAGGAEQPADDVTVRGSKGGGGGGGGTEW
jgi:hypothetical protein